MQDSNELDTNEYINYIDARSDLSAAKHDYLVHAKVFSFIPTPANAAHLEKQEMRLINAYTAFNLRLAEYNEVN